MVPVLREMRLDPSETLAEVGLCSESFDDPDHAIADEKLGRLLRRASEKSGCSDLGLRLGRGVGLRSLGLVGELAARAPDAGTALAEIGRHFGLHDGAGIFALSLCGPHASVTYALHEPGLEASEQRLQHATLVACNALRELCGPAWAPVEVWLPFRRSAAPAGLWRDFRAPLRFDADRAAIVFAREWLERPNPGADAAEHARLARLAEQEGRAAPESLPSEVRRVVRASLLEGKPSIDAVAAALAVHRRTLDRRLGASGWSFRRLAEGVRYELACQLLRATDLSVTRIASALHYNDASAFDHAFRRWSGTTPSAWRHAARPAATSAASCRSPSSTSSTGA